MGLKLTLFHSMKQMSGKYHYIGTYCQTPECSMFLQHFHGPRLQIHCPQKNVGCILVYRKEGRY